MKKTGYLFDKRYLLHDTGPFHPEVAERLGAIDKGIEDAGLMKHLTLIHADQPDYKWIETVHPISYIRRFEEICLAGHRTFDVPDNQMSVLSFETALLAVGGVLSAIDQVMAGTIDNAFCAVRPPGHHAESEKAMGFCYFNNIAIGAKYLRKKYRFDRVAIIDIDVHHGNGTEKIFERDPSVFYYSVHQHPSFAYPGTGRDFDKGVDKGIGYTKNSPILPGEGDDAYKRCIQKDLIPAMENFKPQFILVSTGFDAHIDDEMSDISLTTEGYSWVMKEIMTLSERHADGKLISVLEGGYCLKRLGELAKNHIKVLLNQ